RHMVDVICKENGVGYPGVYAAQEYLLVLQAHRVIKLEVSWCGKLQLDQTTLHFRLYDTRKGLKAHRILSYTLGEGKPRCTSPAIATHLCFRSISIKKPPSEVVF